MGPLFEMHVHVTVLPGEGSTSRLRLRFSGGWSTAIVLPTLIPFCAGAFAWALSNLVVQRAWDPIYGAGLLAPVVPLLLILAMQSAAADDEMTLWQFVAELVDGERSG